MYLDIHELESIINQMRKHLIHIAKTTGLNSDATLRYSQKLDKLITIYQHQSKSMDTPSYRQKLSTKIGFKK